MSAIRRCARLFYGDAARLRQVLVNLLSECGEVHDRRPGKLSRAQVRTRKAGVMLRRTGGARHGPRYSIGATTSIVPVVQPVVDASTMTREYGGTGLGLCHLSTVSCRNGEHYPGRKRAGRKALIVSDASCCSMKQRKRRRIPIGGASSPLHGRRGLVLIGPRRYTTACGVFSLPVLGNAVRRGDGCRGRYLEGRGGRVLRCGRPRTSIARYGRDESRADIATDAGRRRT